MKNFVIKTLPWVITVIALWVAFKGVDWSALFTHVKNANYLLLVAAFFLTLLSYTLRSRRWQFLFNSKSLRFIDAAKVLFLGFFMNNVLPARTGELVRAHAGAKVSGEKRTLVLATIVNERLADGLTLSLFFVLFALHAGDSGLSKNLLYVAILFVIVAVGILAMILFRAHVFHVAELLHAKVNTRATQYALEKIRVFVEGLAPLFSAKKLPYLVLWSVVIWGIELLVYFAIGQAFHAELPLPSAVLFLVAVNFSSLIPAAPGGIGTIEMVASAALVSLGIDKELALSMVIAQHAIQYVVVGIPGAIVMLNWSESLKQLQEVNEPDLGACEQASR